MQIFRNLLQSTFYVRSQLAFWMGQALKPRVLHMTTYNGTSGDDNYAGTSGADMIRQWRQSFHDGFVFQGSEYQQLKQVGNAVPPLLGYVVASAVKRVLRNARQSEVRVR